MSYILYGLYNIVYQILTIWFLLMANTYFNGFIIPDSLKWSNGKLRENLAGLATAQTIILLVEAAVLMLLLFYINKRYLVGIAKAENANNIALWTTGIYSFITVVFIVFLIYTAFK